jgi:hypothetical protein
MTFSAPGYAQKLSQPSAPLVLRYSVDVAIGELRTNPAALAILQREVPQIVGSKNVPDEVSLRALVMVAPQLIPPEKLRRIDAALRALPRT